MPSNIQLAEQVLSEERARMDGTERDAAISVVMRLQLREEQLLGLLAASLEREATLIENLTEAMGVTR